MTIFGIFMFICSACIYKEESDRTQQQNAEKVGNVFQQRKICLPLFFLFLEDKSEQDPFSKKSDSVVTSTQINDDHDDEMSNGFGDTDSGRHFFLFF